jgi:surfeit locus 1 family protein
MRFQPLPVMTVFTLVSLGILVWLGQWQWDRYRDKLVNPPGTRDPAREVSVEIDTKPDIPAQQVYGVADGEPIWRRYVPGRLAGTGERVLILENATGGPKPVALPLDGLDGWTRTARVFARPNSRASARNRPSENIWYVFDARGIADRFAMKAQTVRVVEPVEMTVIAADGSGRSRRTANPYAAPRPIDPLPPQRHFGYALTWWGLAVTLVGVYLAYHRAQGRLRF